MTAHLTAGQRALLESTLLLRQHALDQQLAERTRGQTRAEHAREVLLQDGDDEPQRKGEREMDLALTDIDMQELGAVSEALRRLAGQRYGLCADCGAEIVFDRLKIEPWAMRCVECQAAHEHTRAG